MEKFRRSQGNKEPWILSHVCDRVYRNLLILLMIFYFLKRLFYHTGQVIFLSWPFRLLIPLALSGFASNSSYE
jgi:uncharacterized membrane protein